MITADTALTPVQLLVLTQFDLIGGGVLASAGMDFADSAFLQQRVFNSNTVQLAVYNIIIVAMHIAVLHNAIQSHYCYIRWQKRLGKMLRSLRPSWAPNVHHSNINWHRLSLLRQRRMM